MSLAHLALSVSVDIEDELHTSIFGVPSSLGSLKSLSFASLDSRSDYIFRTASENSKKGCRGLLEYILRDDLDSAKDLLEIEDLENEEIRAIAYKLFKDKVDKVNHIMKVVNTLRMRLVVDPYFTRPEPTEATIQLMVKVLGMSQISDNSVDGVLVCFAECGRRQTEPIMKLFQKVYASSVILLDAFCLRITEPDGFYLTIEEKRRIIRFSIVYQQQQQTQHRNRWSEEKQRKNNCCVIS